jgi:hypothetical protein
MITLGFNGNLNTSIDIGDSVYYIVTSTVGADTDNSTQFTTGGTDWIFVGTISTIQTSSINNYSSPYYTSEQQYLIDETNVAPGVQVDTKIEIQEGEEINIPPAESFIFFSKDNKYNMSSLTGYYSEVQFKNNSTDKAELFATSCDIAESSK